MGTVHTVDNAQGQQVGVVGLDVSLKQLTELVKQIKLGESGLKPSPLQGRGLGEGLSRHLSARSPSSPLPGPLP